MAHDVPTSSNPTDPTPPAKVVVRLCPSCRVPAVTETCPSCDHALDGAALLPTRAAHTGSLLCPRCADGSRLKEIDLTGAVIDICQRCSGLWIEPEELGVLARAGEGDESPPFELAASGRGTPGHRCPHCTRPMLRDRYARVSEVTIDVCAEHGVWLDSRELVALRRFVADGGPERAEKTRRYLQQARRTFAENKDPLHPFLRRWMTWRG